MADVPIPVDSTDDDTVKRQAGQAIPMQPSLMPKAVANYVPLRNATGIDPTHFGSPLADAPPVPAIPVGANAPNVGAGPAPVAPILAPKGNAIPIGRKPGIEGTIDPNTQLYNMPPPHQAGVASLWSKAENIRNPYLRVLGEIGAGAARGLDTVGSIVAPGLAARIPSKRESGQTREALANEAALKAEQQALSDILHKELAKRTGLTPEQVGGLRQRYGRMYSIADQTEAAMNQRQSSAGKAVEGRRDIPTTAAGVGADLFNRVVCGGPEGIANKQFGKALSGTRGIPISDLPEPTPVASHVVAGRPIIPRGELQQGTPIPIEETSPEEITAQQEKLAGRQQGNIIRRRLASERRPIPLWKRGEQD